MTLQEIAFSPTVWMYAGFVVAVLLLLALDLGVLHRKAHTPTMRASLAWTAGWITLAMLFAGVVYLLYENHVTGLGQNSPILGSPGQTQTLSGWEATKLYLTAYLVEKSLSLDNVFVISMIFSSLSIPVAFQHRVLFWGILGALVLRGVMIAVGAAVVAEFAWITYVFGAVLVFSALKMALGSGHANKDSSGRFVRLISVFMPVSTELEGQKLISRVGGRWHATPLLVALVVIEASDAVFAVDSIPAVFAITSEPFIVFTSNIMAILGLRSLYFCLASAVLRFRYLKAALVAILLFVGVKMCLVHTDWKIPADVSAAVVLGILLSGFAVSLLVRNHPVETPPGEGIIPDTPTPRPRWSWKIVSGVWRSNRTIRRVAVLAAGSVVLLTGVIISPLPGPGLTILGPVGIAILASEFLWARRFADGAVSQEGRLRRQVDRAVAPLSRLYIVPLVAALAALAWLLSEHSPIPTWALWTFGIPIATPLCYVFYRWHRVRSARAADRGGRDEPAHAAGVPMKKGR